MHESSIYATTGVNGSSSNTKRVQVYRFPLVTSTKEWVLEVMSSADWIDRVLMKGIMPLARQRAVASYKPHKQPKHTGTCDELL